VATIARWIFPCLCLTMLAGCAVSHGEGVSTGAGRQVSATPSRAEADILLAEAHRLAQAHDYDGLCRTVAQDERACRQILQWASIAHAAPSADSPAVLAAHVVPDTRNTQGAEVLSIRGTRADGTTYTNDFSAVRTTDGQIRSQNAIYWYSTLGH
jgi:hypothetical protein